MSAALAGRRDERAALSFAAIGPIAVHFPEKRETIDTLRAEFPEWDVDLIYRKTGINTRYIARADETAADLGAPDAIELALTVTLKFNFGGGHAIGNLRLSATDQARPIRAMPDR